MSAQYVQGLVEYIGESRMILATGGSLGAAFGYCLGFLVCKWVSK